MNSKITFLLILSFFSLALNAQIPQGFNFQGIARDINGTPLTNTVISIEIQLHSGGTIAYSESQELTTDLNGIYSLVVGQGESIMGSFDLIDWSVNKEMTVLLDIENDNVIDIEFTTPFSSVPYALYAEEVINNDDDDANPLNEIQELLLENDSLSISNANGLDLSKYAVVFGDDPSDIPIDLDAGQLYYDQVCKALYLWTGEAWNEISLNNSIDDIYDKDGDGILNAEDNCLTTFNPDQSDLDNDGEGDECDMDIDGDGIDNDIDNCPIDFNPDQIDEDNDGEGDACDDSIDVVCVPGISSAFEEFNTDAVSFTFDGEEVIIESNGLPNHTSPYWEESNPLYIEPIVASRQTPGRIGGDRSYTLTVPISPEIAANSTVTGLGPIGLSVTGVPIFNDLEGPNRPLEEMIIETFDYAGAHNGPSGYHYHIEASDVEENTVLSFDDEKLVGIMMDGFLLYGRKEMDGSYPTDLDESGGHFGVTPHSCGEEVYHYHIVNEYYFGTIIALFAGELRGTPNAFF